MPPTELLISAGEASGDMYAARLARALHDRADVRLFGMGGPQMRQAGVETVVDSREVALVGLLEVLPKLPAIARAWRRLLAEARRRRPPFAILTDFPGFHVRLARSLQRLGTQNIYFVCPQFWAWRPGRVRNIRRHFVRGLCIFPFEVKFYGDAGVPVDWIGHPLVDFVRPALSRDEFIARYDLDPATPIVTLLPGSRTSELAQNLPPIVEAASRLASSRPCQFVLALAPGLAKEAVASHLRGSSIRIVESATYDALAAADVAIVASGTATVEAALIGAPMIVVYRVAASTALIARRLVRAPFFAMVNLIAGRRIVPELIQEEFTAEKVSNEARKLLDSAELRQQMRNDLTVVRDRLGPPGAIERAADIIAGMLATSTVHARE